MVEGGDEESHHPPRQLRRPSSPPPTQQTIRTASAGTGTHTALSLPSAFVPGWRGESVLAASGRSWRDINRTPLFSGSERRGAEKGWIVQRIRKLLCRSRPSTESNLNNVMCGWYIYDTLRITKTEVRKHCTAFTPETTRVGTLRMVNNGTQISSSGSVD